MGAERLHLGRWFQRSRQDAVTRPTTEKTLPQDSQPHSSRVIRRVQKAEVDLAKRIEEGTAGGDAKDKAELAEYFNQKLGREEFTA